MAMRQPVTADSIGSVTTGVSLPVGDQPERAIERTKIPTAVTKPCPSSNARRAIRPITQGPRSRLPVLNSGYANLGTARDGGPSISRSRLGLIRLGTRAEFTGLGTVASTASGARSAKMRIHRRLLQARHGAAPEVRPLPLPWSCGRPARTADLAKATDLNAL